MWTREFSQPDPIRPSRVLRSPSVSRNETTTDRVITSNHRNNYNFCIFVRPKLSMPQYVCVSVQSLCTVTGPLRANVLITSTTMEREKVSPFSLASLLLFAPGSLSLYQQTAYTSNIEQSAKLEQMLSESSGISLTGTS